MQVLLNAASRRQEDLDGAASTALDQAVQCLEDSGNPIWILSAAEQVGCWLSVAAQARVAPRCAKVCCTSVAFCEVHLLGGKRTNSWLANRLFASVPICLLQALDIASSSASVPEWLLAKLDSLLRAATACGDKAAAPRVLAVLNKVGGCGIVATIQPCTAVRCLQMCYWCALSSLAVLHRLPASQRRGRWARRPPGDGHGLHGLACQPAAGRGHPERDGRAGGLGCRGVRCVMGAVSGVGMHVAQLGRPLPPAPQRVLPFNNALAHLAAD